jgi:hypothetical protein
VGNALARARAERALAAAHAAALGAALARAARPQDAGAGARGGRPAAERRANPATKTPAPAPAGRAGRATAAGGAARDPAGGDVPTPAHAAAAGAHTPCPAVGAAPAAVQERAHAAGGAGSARPGRPCADGAAQAQPAGSGAGWVRGGRRQAGPAVGATLPYPVLSLAELAALPWGAAERDTGAAVPEQAAACERGSEPVQAYPGQTPIPSMPTEAPADAHDGGWGNRRCGGSGREPDQAGAWRELAATGDPARRGSAELSALLAASRARAQAAAARG